MDTNNQDSTERRISIVDLVDSESNDSLSQNKGYDAKHRKETLIDITDSNSSDSDYSKGSEYYKHAGSTSGVRTRSSHSPIVIHGSDSSNDDIDEEEEDDEDIEWIGNFSDSETECDNENWDDSIVIDRQDNNGQVKETPVEEDEEPPAKKIKLPETIEYDCTLKDTEVQKNILDNWTQDTAFQSKNIVLYNEPFKLCVVENFLSDDRLLKGIRKEMDELSWRRRRLDLFEYFQTNDLINVDSKHISQFYNYLKLTVMPLVSEVTGLELTHVSASCSMYTHTDHLLVHDDLRGDRCVAFILYVSDYEPWDVTNHGGALQMFSKDEQGQPNAPVRDIAPKNNQFVFFQVATNSYHQVAEVLTKDYCRLSINGWFHNKNIIPDEPPKLAVPVDGLYGLKKITPVDQEVELDEWITPIYLDKQTCKNIQTHIEELSEISLEEYFNSAKFICINEQLEDENITWKWVGPANRRKYEVAVDNLPGMLKEFVQLFQTKKMFKLLQDYTELDLNPGTKNNPTMRFELQRWTPSCYSLMSETDWFTNTELDIVIYLGCQRSSTCGQILYVAVDDEGEQEALVTLTQKYNTINLVYRDSGTARIVPHLSQSANNTKFYVLVCSFLQ